jgi:hypothetical protein
MKTYEWPALQELKNPPVLYCPADPELYVLLMPTENPTRWGRAPGPTYDNTPSTIVISRVTISRVREGLGFKVAPKA